MLTLTTAIKGASVPKVIAAEKNVFQI